MAILNLVQKIIHPNDTPNFIERAFEFAKEAHGGQKRLSGEDYIQHPLRVAEILSQMHLDSKTIAAGLLHDVPDDTPKTLKDIEKEFGKDVAFLVEGVSKLGKLRYPKDGSVVKPIESRVAEPVDLRAENLRKMFFAMAEDIRVILIKLADRLHNMETLGALPAAKQKSVALETLEIFAPIANRLGMGDMKGRLEDLAFPYVYPKEFEWLITNVKEKYEGREKYLQKLKPVLMKILEREGIKPIDLSTRAKHYWSLYQKLLRHEMNFEKMYDLVALRIIVDSVEACYRILGIIHRHWRPLPGLINDYIAFPKPNQYRALHTTCFCPEGKITEIQIKTRLMHEEAEHGIAAHWAYKEGIDLKNQQKKFSWVAQLSNWQKGIDNPQEFMDFLKIDFFRNRIFVFTPRGDVIDLPDGASPVDFAYAVHTDLGNRCSLAKVNGRTVALNYPLKNGDVIEIITEKDKNPSRDWLEFVKTSLARSRIRNWLKKESRPTLLDRGLKLLNEELKQIQRKSFVAISEKKKEQLLEIFSYKTLEDLLVAVGQGEVSPKEIVKKLFQVKEIFPQALRRPRARLRQGKTETAISLAGEAGVQMSLARCCSPHPLDEIRAYVTLGKGASIHKIDCRNLIKAQKKWPQRILGASWVTQKQPCYPVSLLLTVKDRVGLLKDVSWAISDLGVNIVTCRAEKAKSGWAKIKARVEISGWEELDQLFGRLKQVKGVAEIRKA